MKAVCKIIREAGAEDILVADGLCQEGTAKKMLGSSITSGKVTGQDISVNQHECYLTSLQQDTTNGQQSLPLYLAEMKKLPETATEAHEALMAVHLLEGEQMETTMTYNADAKEASGLDGITLNRAARMKWVYTKPLTAAISAELKSMLHLHSSSPHHESGWSRVNRDAEMVVKVMAAVATNPFTTATPSLINISTGECADPTVKDNLTSVKAVWFEGIVRVTVQ
ncbi:hypothetical protein F7725_013604 [Dissostichus mawsoni]|uniref:Uncharacterized protein n=1 Tax=Dissostichus mawsoni TaxID=36200 RepID=A0A7J5Y586_DISMA|nr:hypothetical protein F7725_013604 [Dissostichus mawsoni]